jgi:hypothetical protein
MAMATMDYSCWKEHDGTRDRWMWEVMRIGTEDTDWQDQTIDSGIADTEEAAMEKVKESLRKHK